MNKNQFKDIDNGRKTKKFKNTDNLRKTKKFENTDNPRKTKKRMKSIGRKAGVWILCISLLMGYSAVSAYAAEETGEEYIDIQEESTQAGTASYAEDETQTGLSADSVSGNTMEKQQEESSADTAKDLQETVSANDAENLPKGQYHFIEGDYSSIKKWLDLYCPNGFGVLRSYDEEWWDGLYDYEREFAEGLLRLIVELPEDIYDGQDLEECIQILEGGTDAYDFFEGTIFYGLLLEDLEKLAESGYSLEDLEDFLAGALGEEESALFQEYLAVAGEDSPGESSEDSENRGDSESIEDSENREDTENPENLGKLAAVAEKLASAFSGTYALQDGDLVVKVVVYATGYSGTEHGRIWKISLGGQPAICLGFGKSCRKSFLYNGYYGDEEAYEEKEGPLGYFISHATASGADYVACQIAAWLYMKSSGYTEKEVKSYATAMMDIKSEESLAKMVKSVWNYYSSAKSNPMSYYVFHSDNDNSQDLGVAAMPEMVTYNAPASSASTGVEGGTEEGGDTEEGNTGGTLTETVTATYILEIHKRDWKTEVGLPGCEVDLFDEGDFLETVTTDADGEAVYEVTKEETFAVSYDKETADGEAAAGDGETAGGETAEDGETAGDGKTKDEAQAELDKLIAEFKAKEYTFSTSEATAPVGYVWEANEQDITIADGGTAVFNLTNERTLGAVELIKYDTESECGTAQGDAGLDGAVYGIYAAEDIIHQDGKTGVIWLKDKLVQEAVVGKSPKRNEDGYILNTDGSRHIANPDGTIAYEDTPGKTLFGDLELGSYYIKEITPAEGYMLDETVYPATFTYKWQMVTIESRDETAGSAANELTADDGSTSKSIYSGDYVIKQGIQFIKTSDNAYQTELEPIAGAGFQIYLISGLSGVKDGSIKPMGDGWTADDIMTFYEYDFTGEKTATVYKRTGHERWTEGDTRWLKAGTKQNEYYVGEMFTDEDGRIVTPELPYGTYVVVETTTPENHVCAKPFIVNITQDGGVLYTDNTKQTVEKAYTAKESIRYGDHAKTLSREGRVLQRPRYINNTITEAFLRILKADLKFTVEKGSYITAEEFVRGNVLKEGAAYRIRCLTPKESGESLLALNWKTDGEGYLSYYDANAKEMTGTEGNPFRTTFLRKNGVIADCYITLPQELPIGTYALTELTAPDGYVVNGAEQIVQDCSEGRVNGYEIQDAPLPEVQFTINNGAVYPDGQMGTNKYALMDEYGNLTVTVLQKNQEQKGIIEIYKHGEQLSGAHEDEETLLNKLEDGPFRTIMKSEEASHRDIVFEYEDAPVEGAVFRIYAAEDIYTQELQKDFMDEYAINPADYLIHHEGDVVAEITTDRNGFAYADNLYIGKYKIEEITAGDGFVKSSLIANFEITSQEQTVNFDIQSVDYQNERQKLLITVEKQDGDSEKALSGAVYGLYAEEDIYTNIYPDEKEDILTDIDSGEEEDILNNIASDRETRKWAVRDEPEILYPADTLIATCVTDDDGIGTFDEDLPLGKYYVRELEGPVGYLTSDEKISVDGSYDSQKGGQETERQEHQVLFQNRKTQAVFAKQDIANSKEVTGAGMEIREIETGADGNLEKDAAGEYVSKAVISWTSKGAGEETHYFYKDDMGYLVEIEEESGLPEGKELIQKEGHLIKGLQPDRVYILRERTAPYGYGYAEDILFKIVQMEKDTDITEEDESEERTEEETEGEAGEGISALYVLDGDTWKRASEDILVMYDENQGLDVEKSTIRMTQQGDTYKYTVDELKNLTEEALDNFTATDKLSEKIYLTELWTGTYNESLFYSIEYRTNRGAEWVVWESDLTTEENHHLTVPENLQTEEKHISQFRFLFGTVGGGFGKEESPVYFTTVLPEAFGTITNDIELTAEQNGRPLKDKDETETIIYLGSIAGYSARGGGFPLYEIVDTDNEVTKEEVTIRRQTIQEIAQNSRGTEVTDISEESDVPEEPEKPQEARTESDVVKTGDDSPIYVLIFLLIAATVGFIFLVWYRKGKDSEKSSL